MFVFVPSLKTSSFLAPPCPRDVKRSLQKITQIKIILFTRVFSGVSLQSYTFTGTVLSAIDFTLLFVYFQSLTQFFFCLRFHFATIVVSYALGCSACYFGLTSSALQEYLEKLRQNHLRNSQKEEQDEVLTKVRQLLFMKIKG